MGRSIFVSLPMRNIVITVSLCTARFEPVNFLEDPSSGQKPLHTSREHDRHSLTPFPVLICYYELKKLYRGNEWDGIKRGGLEV